MFKVCFALFALLGIVLSTPWVAEPRDKYWMTKHHVLLNLTEQHKKDIQVVFLGDSITEGWGDTGRTVFKNHYEKRHVFNYGIGGDRTEHILWRLQNKELDSVNAKVVSLMIGTNNISHKDNATAISKGVNAILEELYHQMPNTKVLLISVLPRHSVETDTQVHEVNKNIKRFADHKRVHWLDLSVFFESSLGHEIEDLYVPDHVHLTEKGYELWAKKMEPSLKHLLADK